MQEDKQMFAVVSKMSGTIAVADTAEDAAAWIGSALIDQASHDHLVNPDSYSIKKIPVLNLLAKLRQASAT